MEEDKKIQAAAGLVAIIALVLLVIQFAGSRAASKPSSGPGWYSRISPFGSAPSAEPSPAGAAPELAAPERVMTNAATRLFSSPTSAGSAGGLAGADPPAAPADAAYAPMNATRLSGGGVDLPSGGRAPTAGGGFPPSMPPAGARVSAPAGGGPAGIAGGGGSSPGTGARSGGKAPSGETAAAAAASAAFGGAARSSLATGGSAGAPAARSPASAGGGAFNDAAALPASAASGGGGLDAGGGGGGGSGGGGLGGKLPGGGKPKESAGKPAGADASAGAAAGGPGGSPSGGPDSSGPPGEITAPSAVIGAPQVGTTTVSGGLFKSTPNGPADVPTHVHVTAAGKRLIGFTAKMAIDTDGAGGAWKGDKTGQPETSLLYKNGDSLNPRVIPFIVVPTDFHLTHPAVKLGDYATVSYGAKTLYAIIGDKGPAGVLGEGSMSLASGLGINADPNRGGITRKDVRYMIAPGTRDAEPPRDAATIQARGKAVFDAAGAPVR